MIQNKASKPKRGVTKFIIDGKEWYYYITVESGNYLLCDNKSFGLGCDYKEMAPESLKPVANPRKEINRVSSKQDKINRAYAVICSQFKKDHPICQARIKCSGALTTEVHHKRGRGKGYMLDSTTYLGCCGACHKWINENNEQATALGFCQSRLSIQETIKS